MTDLLTDATVVNGDTLTFTYTETVGPSGTTIRTPVISSFGTPSIITGTHTASGTWSTFPITTRTYPTITVPAGGPYVWPVFDRLSRALIDDFIIDSIARAAARGA